jgi:adenylate cyclase
MVNLPLDTDKTVRRFQWWLVGIDEETAEDVPYPALGVATAALYSGVNPRKVITEEVQPQSTFLGKRIRWQPGGESPTSLIRFHGLRGSPAGPDSTIPYENVFLVGTPEVNAEAERHLREQIRGKIVLIGDATLISQDFHRVPVLTPSAEGEADQQSPGVETQAQVIQTALAGSYPTVVAPEWQVLLLLLACLLTAVLGKALDPRFHLAAAVLIVWGIGYASIKLLAWYGLVMEPVTATLGVVLAFIGQGVLMHFAERRGREFARRQLGRHVGAGAAARLVDSDDVDLEGEEVELTMLFSDLQGFTTLSETRSSREMCDVLNEYFGEVIFPIVAKHGGSTDKLMGDGLMAYFGWPDRHPDHAARAVRCALEMQVALDRWQREPDNVGLPPLRTRIGIHTGEATVGLIGSGERVELTVIGDVVNVASRLEGMNKQFGTTILISEATRLEGGVMGQLTPRGVETVRGRQEPMPVYSLEPEPAVADNSSL